MGETGRKNPVSGQSPGICPDASRHAHFQPVGATGQLPAYPRKNMVYQMYYSISENTRYDSAAQTSVPYSWTLSWSLRTNAPGSYRQAKIAGQDRKVFASREALDKVPEWPYQGTRPLLYGISRLSLRNTPTISRSTAVCPRLHHRREEPAKPQSFPTGGTHATANVQHHPGTESLRERSMFHFS